MKPIVHDRGRFPCALFCVALCCVALAAFASCAPGFNDHVPRGPEVRCDGKLGAGGVRARLWKVACDGFCPVYEVNLCGDGTVVYDGLVFVKVHGRKTRMLSREQLEQALRLLDRVADGTGPLDDCVGFSSPHLAYVKADRQHWLAPQTPDAQSTYDAFERAVGSDAWSGTEAERARLSSPPHP